MYSLGPLGSGGPFPALPGLPGSSTDLSLRAVPNHPGRSGGLARCCPADVRLHHFWQTGHLHMRNEAESGSLTLRLAGLLPRFPPVRSPPLAPVQLHVRTSNSHGELLSVHKIKPGLAWYSRDAEDLNFSSLTSMNGITAPFTRAPETRVGCKEGRGRRENSRFFFASLR